MAFRLLYCKHQFRVQDEEVKKDWISCGQPENRLSDERNLITFCPFGVSDPNDMWNCPLFEIEYSMIDYLTYTSLGLYARILELKLYRGLLKIASGLDILGEKLAENIVIPDFVIVLIDGISDMILRFIFAELYKRGAFDNPSQQFFEEEK